MAGFKLHKLTHGEAPGSKTFYFLAKDGSYDGIGTETGVTQVTDDDEKTMPPCSIEALLGSTVAKRLVLSLKGTGTKKPRKEIIVAASKAGTAGEALVGKTIDGKECLGAITPRRAVYR